MPVAVLSAGASLKILGSGAVAGLATVAASTVTDPTMMVATLGVVGAVCTAWVNSRATRNRADIDEMKSDMADAVKRADENAALVHKLDLELHSVRVQLTRFEIGTQRLVSQLVQHGFAPVWQPETT